MTRLLELAIAELSKLPDEDQDAHAIALLRSVGALPDIDELIEGDMSVWDRLRDEALREKAEGGLTDLLFPEG